MARFTYDARAHNAHNETSGLRLPGGVPAPTKFRFRGRGGVLEATAPRSEGFRDGEDLGVDVIDEQMLKAARTTPWLKEVV